jgi:hypothetical protein
MAGGIAFTFEVLQYEPAYPNTRDLNIGDDVTGAPLECCESGRRSALSGRNRLRLGY